jgi:hypothetical protein
MQSLKVYHEENRLITKNRKEFKEQRILLNSNGFLNSVFRLPFSVLCLMLLASFSLKAQSLDTISTAHRSPLAANGSFIIEFNQPPATTLINSPAKASIDYDQPAQQLLTYLNYQLPNTHSQLPTSNSLPPIFKNTFHGMVLDLPEAMVDVIRALPYIKNVYPDHEVSHFGYESVYQIHADSVWRQYGTRGEGITIGIIDSGVDYTHPALGGGFGPGYKVIDGWDFVDGDADPMDEHRHGTHVAGIAAGNAESTHNDSESVPFLGVAPDAFLVAYRVLDENGRGRTSNIIAAIERAVDPNMDGDFSDRLDVVNLSLGSDFGSPEDPTSTAVNNATLAGVVVVVAAGNSGHVGTGFTHESNFKDNGSQTIGSPGMAERAITVGAVDRDLSLARFSSKGPVNTTFALKPDVVAPGVGIFSSVPGGAMDAFNGTSMASPHVAGVAALIRAIRPNWTPDQVKSAITNTAIPLQMPEWHQGTGFIDPVQALKTTTLISPSNAGFGMSNAFQSIWTETIEFTLQNHSETTQSYTFSSTGLPTGATITFSEPHITIPSQSSRTFTAQLSVNHSLVPIVSEDIRTYSGRISVQSEFDFVTIPWSFSRSSVMRIAFTRPYPQVIVSSPQDYYTSSSTSKFNQFHWITPQRAEIYASKPGFFAIATAFHEENQPSRLVLNESVNVMGSTSFTSISHNDALHSVTLRGVDHTGRLLSEYDEVSAALTLSMEDNLITMAVYSPVIRNGPTFYVSTISQNHTIYVGQSAVMHTDEPVLVVPKFPNRKGVSSSFSVNGLVALHSIPLEFHLDNFGNTTNSHWVTQPPVEITSIPSKSVLALVGFYGPESGFDFKYSEQLHILNPVPDSKGIARVHYYTPDNSSSAGMFSATRFLIGEEVSEDFYSIDIETEPLTVWNSRIIPNLPYLSDVTAASLPIGSTVSYGIGPIYSMVRPSLNLFGPGSINLAPLIRGPMHETRYADYPNSSYSIRSIEGTLLAQGALNDIPRDLTVPVGIVDIEVSLVGNQLRGKQVTTKVISRSDLNKSGASPPWIFSQLLANTNGVPVQAVLQDEEVVYTIAARSVQLMNELEVDPARTTVEWRVHGTNQQWTSAPLTNTDPSTPGRDGIRFTANLTEATAIDSVAIDLRFKTVDSNDSSTELFISPAFAVGNWVGQTETSIDDPHSELPTQLTLNQNYPNPFNPTTNITFTLPNTSAFTDIRLSVYNLLGQELLRLAEGPTPSGTHTITFNASNLASGVYMYQLSTPNSVLTKKMMLIR